MATVSKWTPFGVALDITATGGTVTRTSATQFTVKINASWETYYSGAQTNYGMSATSGGTTSTSTIISAFNGTKRSSGSSSFTGTYSISGNGSASKTITVTFKNFNTDNGDSASKNVSFTVTVPAWTSYAIKYNANGGSGAPSSQTKWKDQALTLSSTKPTRTGYSFLGWSTSSTATSATYSAGGKYTANAAATLYAVWEANTYTVTYNANGGSGAPSNQTKTYGVTLTLSSVKPTRTNYTFKGWGTSASATTVTYSAGGSYSANANITLYAVWELSYTKPKISNFAANRCNSSGTVTDDGTYCRIVFDWSTSRSISNSGPLIEWESGSGESGSTIVAASGTSGSVNAVVGNGALSTEATWTIRVTVSDSGGSSYASRSLPGLKFAFDVLSGGKGVAFGKTAEKSDYADFAFSTHHRKDAIFENNRVLRGTNPDGTEVEALNFQNANGNTVLGYGNYDRGAGNTNIYGFNINFGVSNIATPGTYKPYLSRGDSITVTFRGAGYVTNGKKDVSFWLPLTTPVIGSPTITVASGNGFTLRQGDSYTHGSSASSFVTPTSYEASNSFRCGLYIKAVFTDTTNVTNNDTIGIYWHGTITFS
jgi:uncharacterized repeat protein (TIGR02543 family)